MLNAQMNRHQSVKGFGKKVIRPMALAFFLCTLPPHPAHAATNIVTGTAFGTNDWTTAPSISSEASSDGSLIVGFAGTTNITLNHDVIGFIIVTNNAPTLTIDASAGSLTGSEVAALAFLGSSNITVNGGSFVGATGGSGNFPPIPGQDFSGSSSALGGLAIDSELTIDGSTFTGADGLEAFVSQNSKLTIIDGSFSGGAGAAALRVAGTELEIHDGIFVGGEGGSAGKAALVAYDESNVTIHDGSFTGQVGSTAFYLQNSDATVEDGTFVGNLSGTGEVAGEGLFCEQTDATTNNVTLNGGSFRSVAFYGVDGSLANFLTGTNLSIENGIVQNGGTVVVSNLSNSALQDISVYDGTMQFMNSFTLSSNGMFQLLSDESRGVFESDLTMEANSYVYIGLGQINVTGDFMQSSNSTLYFAVNETTNGLLTAITAAFATNSTIVMDATQAGFGSGSHTVTVVKATSALTGTDYIVPTNYVTGRISFDGIQSDGNNLSFRFTTEALADYWNATGQFAVFATELDGLAGDSMLSAIDSYNSAKNSRAAIEQTYFATFNSFQTALHGMRAAVGPSISRGTEFREQIRLVPVGVRGPQRRNDLRGWGKYYGQYITHDKEGINPEYDTFLHGGAVGVDRSFGNLLLGVGGGAGQYLTTYEPNAEERVMAAYGNAYGTFGTDRGYIDGGVVYGHNQVDTQTSKPFRLDGEYDAQIIGGYLGGGYDLVDTKGGTVFTPEIGVQYAQYRQDAYTETGTGAVPRMFDEFDAESLLSSLGMNVSMLNTQRKNSVGFKLEGRFHWMHEFNSDPGDAKFMLEGGSNQYTLGYPSLDENMYKVGIGGSFFNTERHKPKNVMLRLDFDELFGEGFNSHNVSAKLAYAF